MPQALIKIAFRQMIDASANGSFEKNVFNDSYSEFLMQAQAYNTENKFRTFHELIADNPKANSLHYKVGFAIGLYVRELNNHIPGLLDSMGRSILPIAMHRFEIVESDITDKSCHKVAITYETETLTLFAVVGEYLVLARGDKSNEASSETIETFLIKVQSNLSIISWQDIAANKDPGYLFLRQTQSN